jgi:hypothetical protein
MATSIAACHGACDAAAAGAVLIRGVGVVLCSTAYVSCGVVIRDRLSDWCYTACVAFVGQSAGKPAWQWYTSQGDSA